MSGDVLLMTPSRMDRRHLCPTDFAKADLNSFFVDALTQFASKWYAAV